MLCPAPWRVPTAREFETLDITFGGTGEPTSNSTLRNRYLNDWGGVYSGRCDSIGVLNSHGGGAFFWSQSQVSFVHAINTSFYSDGSVNSQGHGNKEFGFSLRCVRDTTPPPPPPAGCLEGTPGWGASLGTVSFATDNTWTLGNQIWSDVVTATSCQKETYNGGGSAVPFYADCRSNPKHYPGNWFSWCAVVRFQHQLCPAPWRVPTAEDFLTLHRTLGGIEIVYQENPTLANKYLNDWGATPGGAFSHVVGGPHWVGVAASYWSLSELNVNNAAGLNIHFPNSAINIRINGFKSFGKRLRCVRDN